MHFLVRTLVTKKNNTNVSVDTKYIVGRFYTKKTAWNEFNNYFYRRFSSLTTCIAEFTSGIHLDVFYSYKQLFEEEFC